MAARRGFLRGGALLLAGAGGFAAVTSTALALSDSAPPRWIHDRVPPRQEQLRKLSQGTAASPYDVLIIGGGATGTGCAVDAATRGLRTAMIEREDFAAGTSSRSTKLVHGGVRYLEKAFKNLDYGQFKLVFEALHERNVLLQNVPYLSNPLPIMTPCYKWWEAPYFWAGLRMYDLIAGSQGLEWCRFLTPSQALSRFPTLCSHRKGDGQSLKGAIVYHDGQFNDSRLAVVLACTAAAAGATVVNYCEAVRLLKDGGGKVVGAVVRDNLSGKEHSVHARTVINAAGPFSDEVRHLSQPDAPKMIMPSSGVHVTLPDYYSPEAVGMIVPKTKDGRVVFMLPWLEQTIAGTTDSSTDITMRPQPTEDEIQFILDAISDYLTVKVRRSDVQSAWSGIRPLALDPNAADTASASRDHIVTVDPDGMITVTGGKWTTYRLMAQDAIDRAVAEGRLQAGGCSTAHLKLIGAEGFYPALFTEVAQNYTVPHRPGAIDTRVAKYLVASYGDRAGEVTHIAEQRRLGKRIVRGYPILEAEVIYAVHNEYCETPEDFIARRTRLAFLDRLACEQALPRVVELMASEKGWSRSRARSELQRALDFLKTFEAPPAPAAAAAAAASA